jgi:arsenite methyltransferase
MVGPNRVQERPDYGIDAPSVIRNLFIAAVVGVSAWTVTMLISVSGRFDTPRLALVITGMGFTTGIGCGLMAAWMLYYSKIGKLRNREWLLNRIRWSGRERVLDVGCGRGLLLNGAARRLNSGWATGIDVWNAEDLTGNRPEAVLDNARRERVDERVSVQTADMRKLPFANAVFDVVVSSAVIHNLYNPADRAEAIREIARVLAPGGHALIQDIRHHRQYARIFSENGCGNIRKESFAIPRLLLMVITFGSLRPATLVVRKD